MLCWWRRRVTNAMSELEIICNKCGSSNVSVNYRPPDILDCHCVRCNHYWSEATLDTREPSPEVKHG